MFADRKKYKQSTGNKLSKHSEPKRAKVNEKNEKKKYYTKQ